MKPEDKAVVQQALWVVRELMDDEHTHEALERADKAIFALRQLLEQTEPSVTVRYDLSAADTEAAIRDKLIELGWTPPAQPESVQEEKQSEIFCGVDFADGVLSVSVLRRRPNDVAELLHSEQIDLPLSAQPATWVRLTDEEIRKEIPPHDAWKYEVGHSEAIKFARTVLAKATRGTP
jgi:hypothetical protein